MSSPKFQIPPEFESKLRHVEPLDSRSDQEILKSLKSPLPVTSEKNIWAFWDSGLDNLPSWGQRNIINWARLCGPDWVIRVLDDVPDSPNNALNWVKEDQLPQAYIAHKMDGPRVRTGPHSADFLRGICLYQYGGAWVDVGTILVRSIDDLCWKKLEDPNSPYQVSAPWMYSNVVANHFIASRKSDMFIKHWHDVFMEIWKGRNSSDGIFENPLVSFAQDMNADAVEARNFKWNWSAPLPKVLEYIAQIVCWIRVAAVKEPNGGFDGVDYFDKKILLHDSLYEDWPAEAIIGWNGEDLFDLFSVRLDADPESEEYKKAYNVVWTILTASTMQKVTHAAGMTATNALGTLWDMKENENRDREPGTFAELLRYGSVHFEQNREIEYITPPKADFVLEKGVLEP
ncbi:capsule polysaccharide biosynthesis protein [Colletotrichum scovillei]|uniref:Capsule polysaccharide biosynthesis protein n=1 Tax=Colletotrichum scovillei TaxID=1209932 RepID=A0A9P7UE03_9PEZI|nr:capsule polysaccharide biosynthesis protein [Colletotrichum scovillei]KAF4782639.1 capsule polysaccharide biosynthesis protein [Colletotrichum scovillei]KAG7053048.1 capsule polysaccharide biosynthesis protein [Colletotrichum scovillei]KAG7071339.1 capsule polysaccharide biosynthesis protein [Colletotrichum scovillei]KAG7079616.1 capsule polysaccharide biosynthesis protein [Colletotrichum scovillei]